MSPATPGKRTLQFPYRGATAGLPVVDTWCILRTARKARSGTRSLRWRSYATPQDDRGGVGHRGVMSTPHGQRNRCRSPKKQFFVAGGGGFIGGHLTKRLLEDGLRVRCVDIRPIDKWEQVFADAENIVADLRIHQSCQKACEGVSEVYNLAADMGGMGFLERNKACCMVSVLINTNLLRAAREARVERYFFASSACVYSPKNVQGQDVVIFREEHVSPGDAVGGIWLGKAFFGTDVSVLP